MRNEEKMTGVQIVGIAVISLVVIFLVAEYFMEMCIRDRSKPYTYILGGEWRQKRIKVS